MELAGRNVVAGDVRVLELVQPFSGERSCADENDLLFALGRHLLSHEVNPAEPGVIDRQAVVVLDQDAGNLPGSGNQPQAQYQ